MAPGSQPGAQLSPYLAVEIPRKVLKQDTVSLSQEI